MSNHRIQEGFQFVAVSSELDFMLSKARQELAAIQRPEAAKREVKESVRH